MRAQSRASSHRTVLPIPADNGTLVEFALNAAAISDLELVTGLVGIGLRMEDVASSPPEQRMFA